MLFSLKDITLIPASISNIDSRSKCNPYYDTNLPIFTAPMSQIIDDHNYKEFQDNHINPIIPRNILLETRLELCHKIFCAFSLDEFEKNFCKKINDVVYVLIDVANGHMQKILDLCKVAKSINNDNIVIMAGNVANPKTYISYVEAGIDYCRISIGSGSQCTTANTGIYYPMGSLIADTIREKNNYLFVSNNVVNMKLPKIVADGGFKTYGDIIKALALGADYVMCGNIFAKAVEACGKIIPSVHLEQYSEDDEYFQKFIRNQDINYITEKLDCYREYYGMSTKRAQKEFGKDGNKTEEGISSNIKVKYYLKDWVDGFTDYLKSAMSYTNSTNLTDFIGKIEYRILSPTAIKDFTD